MSNGSFHTPYLFPLPYRTPAEVEEILRPFHPFLWPVVMEAWEDLQERRANDRMFTHMTEEELAIWLTMQAGHRAYADFHGKQGIEVRQYYRKAVIIFPETLAITVKKLTKRKLRRFGDKELTRSNSPTNRTKRLHGQERGADLPDMPRVVFGYEFQKEATEIALYLAYPRTKGIGFDWVIELEKPVEATTGFPRIRIFSQGDEAASVDEPGFTISPAPAQEGEREGEQSS